MYWTRCLAIFGIGWNLTRIPVGNAVPPGALGTTVVVTCVRQRFIAQAGIQLKLMDVTLMTECKTLSNRICL